MKNFVKGFKDMFDTDGKVTGTNVIIECPVCGNQTEVFIPVELSHNLELWCSNTKQTVQSLFGCLSATEREVLISGMCPTCQKNFFEE